MVFQITVTVVVVLLIAVVVVGVVSANDNDLSSFTPKVTSDQNLYYIGETIQLTQVTTEKNVVRNHWIVSENDVSTLTKSGSLLPSWYYINCNVLADTTPTPAPISLPTFAPVPTITDANGIIQPVPTRPTSTPPAIPIIRTRNIVCAFTWDDIYSINMFLSNFQYTKESDYSISTKVSLIKEKMESIKFVYVDLNPRDDNSIIVQSNTFMLKLNEINIKLNKNTYAPGETIQLTFDKQYNNVPDPSYYNNHYVKIYQVPFSYKNDITKFNTAKQVKYVSYNTSTTTDTTTQTQTQMVLPITKQVISWEESGTYQIVIFQKHYQVIIAISDTFTVAPITDLQQFDVSINNKTYYPHQDITLDITLPTTSSSSTSNNYNGREVTFTLVHAKVTKQQVITDPSYILDTFTQSWTSSSVSQDFNVMNTIVERGYYKVFVLVNSVSGENNYHMQASTVFQVLSPLITMTTTPSQRRYVQGEIIDFNFYNPYFNFNLHRQNYYGYVSHIVKANFPTKYGSSSKANNKNVTIVFPDVFFHLPISGYDDNNNKDDDDDDDDEIDNYVDDYQNNLRMLLPPGTYRIAIFRIVQKTYDDCDLSGVPPRDVVPYNTNTPLPHVSTSYQPQATHFEVETSSEQFVTSIANTTFTVLPNIFTVNTYKDIHTTNETIYVQLSSSMNIPLSPTPHITWELRSIGNDDIHYPGYHTISGVFEEIPNSPTVLACTIPITWNTTGVFLIDVSNGLAQKEITIQ